MADVSDVSLTEIKDIYESLENLECNLRSFPYQRAAANCLQPGSQHGYSIERFGMSLSSRRTGSVRMLRALFAQLLDYPVPQRWASGVTRGS